MEEVSPRQRRVLEVLTEYEGAAIKTVSTALGCTHPSAAYHLNQLHDKGLVYREREGRKVRHYLITGASDAALRLRARLRDRTHERILRYLATADLNVASINQMAKQAGVSFGLLKRVLQQLERDGFIRLEKRRGRYQAIRNPGFVDAAVKLGFINGKEPDDSL